MSEAIDPDLPLYFKTRITPHSRVKVVEIDYRADPGKRSPEWEVETRRKLITDRAWRREMGRDWTLGEGDSFYPEFELFGGRKVYVRKIPGLINGPVYRGWDFGFRKPACCWFQYSAKSDTVYVLREWSPEDISTHTMADIVKHLSGQLDMERLTPDGMKWLERIHADKTFPPTPWFPRLARPIQFLDFAGPEVTKISPQVEADKKEKTDYQILQSKGINIQWDSVSPSARGADVLYTDVWTSMGQEKERKARIAAFRGYRIDAELLRAAGKAAIVMHCLPAHRGEEIADEVVEGPQSVIFDEAENRRHVQMAILEEFIPH